MASNMEYATKTQLYLKVKKPLLERQRRARINKCLDALKELVAEFQGDDAILRMDKAEMLESTIVFMRTQAAKKAMKAPAPVPMDSFRHGYMNAVGEVSRVMASMPGMSVDLGKAVMTHLGSEFNRLLHSSAPAPAAPAAPAATPVAVPAKQQPLFVQTAPMSPASSGYHSDSDDSSMASPTASAAPVWRPW